MPTSKLYRCGVCDGKVVKTIYYTPDFSFLKGTVVVEAKGRFDAAHRVKAKMFKEQYPHIKYALVFEADNKISTKSKTRYSDWATKNGIPHKIGLITREWLEEITE